MTSWSGGSWNKKLNIGPNNEFRKFLNAFFLPQFLHLISRYQFATGVWAAFVWEVKRTQTFYCSKTNNLQQTPLQGWHSFLQEGDSFYLKMTKKKRGKNKIRSKRKNSTMVQFIHAHTFFQYRWKNTYCIVNFFSSRNTSFLLWKTEMCEWTSGTLLERLLEVAAFICLTQCG